MPRIPVEANNLAINTRRAIRSGIPLKVGYETRNSPNQSRSAQNEQREREAQNELRGGQNEQRSAQNVQRGGQNEVRGGQNELRGGQNDQRKLSESHTDARRHSPASRIPTREPPQQAARQLPIAAARSISRSAERERSFESGLPRSVDRSGSNSAERALGGSKTANRNDRSSVDKSSNDRSSVDRTKRQIEKLDLLEREYHQRESRSADRSDQEWTNMRSRKSSDSEESTYTRSMERKRSRIPMAKRYHTKSVSSSEDGEVGEGGDVGPVGEERVEQGLEVLFNLLGSAQARGVGTTGAGGKNGGRSQSVPGLAHPPDILPGTSNSDPMQYLNQLESVAKVLQDTLRKQKQEGDERQRKTTMESDC